MLLVYVATFLLRAGWVQSPVARHYRDYYARMAATAAISTHDEL